MLVDLKQEELELIYEALVSDFDSIHVLKQQAERGEIPDYNYWLAKYIALDLLSDKIDHEIQHYEDSSERER